MKECSFQPRCFRSWTFFPFCSHTIFVKKIFYPMLFLAKLFFFSWNNNEKQLYSCCGSLIIPGKIFNPNKGSNALLSMQKRKKLNCNWTAEGALTCLPSSHPADISHPLQIHSDPLWGSGALTWGMLSSGCPQWHWQQSAARARNTINHWQSSLE